MIQRFNFYKIGYYYTTFHITNLILTCWISFLSYHRPSSMIGVRSTILPPGYIYTLEATHATVPNIVCLAKSATAAPDIEIDDIIKKNNCNEMYYHDPLSSNPHPLIHPLPSNHPRSLCLEKENGAVSQIEIDEVFRLCPPSAAAMLF